MPKAALQPVTDREAQANLKKSIFKPVPLEVIAQYLPSEKVDYLREVCGGRDPYVWGVKPRSDDSGRKQWEKLGIGDVAFFAAFGRAVLCGSIVLRHEDELLAKRIWNEADEEIGSFPLLYFMSDVKPVDFSKHFANRLMGTKPNDNWQGFVVKSEEVSAPLIRLADEADLSPPAPALDQFKSAIEQLLNGISETDRKGSALRRLEQGHLRNHLFQTLATKSCAFCKETFDPEFMVAAHVKKRAVCSLKERLDFENIVIPLCNFGCDDLFEKGYLIVDHAGLIQQGRSLEQSEGAKRRIRDIIGTNCNWWSPTREPYFKFHRTSVKEPLRKFR
ncbi:hypothetical protein DIT71_03295 [Marinobacter vulgaris]|uniref:HNH endonuclease n=2 Tax=Marinobacter vulgaris TaxID=1928331 RepID=A0A2V3ZMP6_9GAMM|nr:hypothetical protein DIT71_03295 [Marinobacter vulgaris]TSJ71811.1 hypothetical protein FPC41_06170 [Marinobacter vulgaris]